jgi:DNA processing protein
MSAHAQGTERADSFVRRTTEQAILWLRLAHTPGLATRERVALVEHFGGVEALLGSTHALLERVLGESRPACAELLKEPPPERFAATLEWLGDPGRQLLTWLDPDYPPLLREMADPPVMLYVHGARALLGTRQIAIVGSRNATAAGRENARAFARTLTGAGLTVTSGLALGIDGAAHRGALEATGTTIAVVGTGLDRVYPPRHRELAHAIAGRGALVSEFALGTPPRAENFPIRNRVIAGLSLGVLVVEAAAKSGSLITARLGAEAGREVFAIPGSIHSPLARGCHRLIRQGAKLVETAQDVLEELGALAGLAVATAPGLERPGTHPQVHAGLDAAHGKILECLGHDPASVDALVERSGLTAQAVSSILLELELRGLVAPDGGGRYIRAVSVDPRAGE